MPFYDIECLNGHQQVDVWAKMDEHPPCATCGAPTLRVLHQPRRPSMWKGFADVTWPGGKTFENMGHEPVTCYSPADFKRECDKRNLEPFVRHVDGDQHVARWSAITQATLDGAKAMLERVGKASDPTPETWIESMTVTVTEASGTVWAPRGTFGANHAG